MKLLIHSLDKVKGFDDLDTRIGFYIGSVDLCLSLNILRHDLHNLFSGNPHWDHQ